MKNLILLAVLSISLMSAGCAEFKQAGRSVGHATRDAAKEIGDGARDAAKAIGEGTERVVEAATEDD